MLPTTGIIFANIHDNNISELTQKRSIASVPYGCRYRFIDFALSNMVNSGINDIDIITQANYHSLMDHLGSGKDWDLARRSGGLKILPPYISAGSSGPNNLHTRLEALKSVYNVISSITDEYVVLSDCDVICNVDLKDMIEAHAGSNADITVAVKRVKLTKETAKDNIIFSSDENGRITEVNMYPGEYEGEGDISLNILVMRTDILRQIVSVSISKNYTSLTKDIIAKNLRPKVYNVYRFDGYFACISSLEDYFRHSLDLITNPNAHRSLFGVKSRPVYTKVRNSPPSYYAVGSNVRESIIADGCVIEGNVENSVIFRGVKIAKNATVKNSIIMQDTVISEGAYLNCVVADKNVIVRDGIMLSGAETQPFYIEKGKMI